MLEISEVKLPVDHSPEEIARTVSLILRAPPGEVIDISIHKRAIDARRGSG